MKRSLLISALALTTLLASTNCKKVDQTNPEFIGFWTASENSTSYTLDIDQYAKGRYIENNGLGSTKEWSGNVKYKDGELKINILKKLRVDEEPSTNLGITTMVLDGIIFVKN